MTSSVQILSLDADSGSAGLRTVSRLNIRYDRVDESVVGLTFAAKVLDFDEDGATTRIPKINKIDIIFYLFKGPLRLSLKGPCTRFEVEHMLNNQPSCIQNSYSKLDNFFWQN